MELGRLEAVEVRDVWQHEARDFTPWLPEHEENLSEALGIDLELQESEHPVCTGDGSRPMTSEAF